jgi:hypothetical protein
MISTFADPFDALLSLQRALEGQLTSDWLQDSTTSRGGFPPINVFQQGEDLLAIIELPGIDRNDLQIQAKENTIRIPARRQSLSRRASACIGESVSLANSIARCRFRSGSIRPVSRPSTGTGFSPCICRAPRATNLEPLRSTEHVFDRIREEHGHGFETGTASSAEART